MSRPAHILAVVLLTVPLIFAQERCSYMTAIPREPRPDDLAPIEWEGDWADRPLVPAPDREDVCMDMYIPMSANSGTQIIYMDEEIEGDVAIAKLNYAGSSTPVIVTFLSGSRILLGAEPRLVDGEWYLYITQRQDFESGMQSYMFTIQIEGETMVATVSLQIVNIDDNDPIIHVVSNCVVPELGEARLTDCVYEVTDADGEISTRFMTFELESDRATDETLFYVEATNFQNDWFRMNMTIGITGPLDFESNSLHIFRVTALDSLPNTHTVTLMVQVDNVEHRPPRFVEIFAVQQFDEKTERNFTVRAIDGDTGIEKAIYYRLETDPEDTFFSIETIGDGHDGAILMVDPIDRDYLEREVFQFSIIAYKYDNESFATPANVVIIINDINDQRPEPLRENYYISIPEETPLTLDFSEEFGFHDRDLGPNAQYRLEIVSDYPPGAEAAFYIAPDVGYQRQTFVMGTMNHSMLDFEVPDFQHIALRVIATDMNDTNHVGVAMVYIDLVNWNDELPIFENDVQTVKFDETEGAGFYVGSVRAHDRDIDDRVEHTLMGNAADYLEIDIDTGDIYVSIDEAFDYHRQNQLFVQVRADDTLMAPYHTATSQLIIELNDINNTPPTLRLPRRSPQVEENVPEGYDITVNQTITATDPDTSAFLQFEIDWDSSWATKQGQDTDPIEYHECVYIETIFPDESATGNAIGRILVQEIRPGVTIDFEEFEMLYLTVRVRDLNTTLGDDYDEATFTITIIDMNDNPPIWVEGTLTQEFRVREMSNTNTVIGSVLATDIDGPLYNQVRYTIFPRDDTPEDLVKIDFYTGQIAVDSNQAIDADEPPRWNLHYTVIASDRCYADDPADCPPDPTYWDTEGNLTINIIDTNNKVPQADTTRFNTTVYIYENATTGDDVEFLFANDLDRDEIYHNVSFLINYGVNARIRDFFEVDLVTGRLYVYYPNPNDVLDRDGEEPTHRIFFQLIDNFLSQGDTNRNQNETDILVVLLDVNDNAPELPPPSQLSWDISEGLEAGVTLDEDIYAPDRDEPDTDNSRVGYAILSLTITNRDIEVPDLFYMRQVENVTGELVTAMDLKGYWGTYDIHILAYDHGTEPQQQMSNETYQLVINPYNFHHPEFVFPLHETIIRLSAEWAMPGVILRTVANENLNTISATDEDGLKAGVVTFHIQGNADAVEYFEVVNHGNNMGTLQLRREVTDQIREFQVTIRATDGGTDPGPLSTDTTARVVFLPTTGDPVFDVDSYSVAFFEKEVGLTESFQLPLATDSKNHLCDDDCYDIFYRIVDGNDAGHFSLDPATNVISLLSELDRNTSISHTLVIGASNSPTATTTGPGSTFPLTVTVREADPRPRFEQYLYTAGISTADTVNRELLTVHATHSEGATIVYSLNLTSMVVDTSLEAVRETAFILNPQSGLLTLNIQPTAAMHGMFEFDVVATDLAQATDTAEVKVYLVSSINTVVFIFLNTVSQVEASRTFIAQTFSGGLGMTCNIDQVVPWTDNNGIASETTTEIRAHFIDNDIPVHADVIYERLSQDTETLLSIRNVLLVQLIVLQDIAGSPSPDGSDINQITVYVLGILSAILGFMLLVLLLAFIIKTRALNRRLNALSTNKYGSIDSGLNRAGIAAPGTNKHAVEGSNPIWNETIRAPDFDAISDASGDSDLIGIEDMPQFSADYFPGDDDSMRDLVSDLSSSRGRVADHSNNFGFNASPFSQEFSNNVNNGFKRRM